MSEDDRQARADRARPVHGPDEMAFAVDERGCWSFVSEHSRHVYGYEPREMVGRPVTDFLERNARNDRRVFEAIRNGEAQYLTYETEHLDAEGAPISLRITAIGVHDAEGRLVGAAGTARELTDARRAAERIMQASTHDPMTGLLNRRRFEHVLAEHADWIRRYGPQGSVIVIDLDGFREVNESLGHRAGDELLRRVAGQIEGSVGEQAQVSRLGGDEFAVLLAEADGEQAGDAGERLAAAIRGEAAVVGGERVHTTASVGIATFDERQASGDEVLANAMLAVDEVKSRGCDGVAAYSQLDGDRQRRERFSRVDRIKRALADDAFELYAQPICDLQADSVVQHELLLRMRSPDGELVLPHSFLPTAERCGLVQEIDLWVARRAVRALQRGGGGRLGDAVSINVSGRSVGDGRIVQLLAERLEAAGIEPGRLIVEVTETAAIGNLEQARRFSERIAELGCPLAVDDFGAGFGSFYYLKHLAPDFIKIDGDFVRNLPSSSTDRAMVGAIVQVARDLGRRTIAEFVESEAVLDQVRELGVDRAQGYAIGRPEPLEDVVSG